jgi:hypothetical protein
LTLFVKALEEVVAAAIANQAELWAAVVAAAAHTVS